MGVNGWGMESHRGTAFANYCAARRALSCFKGLPGRLLLQSSGSETPLSLYDARRGVTALQIGLDDTANCAAPTAAAAAAVQAAAALEPGKMPKWLFGGVRHK